MAHIAKLGALTDELVTLLTSTSQLNNPSRFNIHRETALRALRTTNHPRTDQFDIASQLSGLEEKFRVYNEDPLADALGQRVREAAATGRKWTPEVLQLLLALSDKPVANSRLGDLELLREPEEEVPALRWEDLVRDDPLLRDKNVWRNVQFGAESSDEEDARSEASGGISDTTARSSVDDDGGRQREGLLVDAVDHEELDKFMRTQFWKKVPSINGVRLETVKKPITELQAVREALFMLSGLPTSLFTMDPKDPTIITPSKSYALKHVSIDAFQKLADDFVDIGSALMSLRRWAERPHCIPLLQVLQDSIAKRLRDFDAYLASIQERFVAITSDVIVTLLGVKVEVTVYIRPLVRLSDIVKQLDSEPYSHTFRYLELLYDETCLSQMAGDNEMYTFMGKIFFDCFDVYLRPIRTWMEDGELGKSDNVFFVSEIAADIEPAAVWQSRFRIRKTQDDGLHAPRFLHAAASRIFTTGKSVVVLKYLNQFESLQSSRTTTEPILDFDTVCNPSTLQLAPFPELFDAAFDGWVRSKHHYASSILRKTLFDACGLHNSLDALLHIYFMADGATAAAFTNSIFDKLDTLDKSWKDHFTLTELARSTFGTILHVNPDRLRTSSVSLPREYQEVARCRQSVKTLGAVQMNYHLSWPLQIIITPDTIPSYQRVFTLLLQIRRASHILSRELPTTTPLEPVSSESAAYYSLRARLLWFTSTLYYYLTSLVIEPNTKRMLTQLKAATDVDGMIEVHASYTKAVISQSLVGSKLIHESILKILGLAIKLADAKAMGIVRGREQEARRETSLASLGLHTPQKKHPVSVSRALDSPRERRSDTQNEEDSEDERELTVDLSVLSNYEAEEDDYAEQLKRLKMDFNTQVRFVVGGLRGVARASESIHARAWDGLAEMLEGGWSY